MLSESQHPDMALDEWNDSLTGHYLWSNTNFGEAVTDVMTPLTWSVIQFTLDDWTFLPGYPTVGVIGGYPYLNISIFATLFRALGRSQQDLLDYMEATLYMQLPAGMEIPLIDVSPWMLLSGLFKTMHGQAKQMYGALSLPSYLENNRGWFQRIRDAVQAVEIKTELYDLWQREMKPHIKRGVWCVLGTTTHSANFTMKLRRDLTDWVGLDKANVLIANLSDRSGPLMSVSPVWGMSKVARGEMSTEDYLRRYGHRGPQEFELSVARPVEDPQWFEGALAAFRQAPVDVDAMLARQRSEFEAIWRWFHARFPNKSRAVRRRIDESARRARHRELARSAYIRDRWAIRLFALQAGELTGLGEDIFFLRLDELLGLLNGEVASKDRIPARKEAYLRYKSLPPYPAVIKGRFDPFIWAADPQRRRDIFDVHAAHAPTKRDQIRGSPGSAGQVEGRVRILSSPEQGSEFQEGEILVATQTDIAWTMIFPRAAAVITDVGAPLSHAAIVARELGIPAVVGCGDATIQLETGDRVRVDGSLGLVTLIDEH